MSKRKIFKYFVIIFLAIFTISYLISVNGYYEYQMSSQKIMTDKQIEQFEKDVQEGKKVDVEDYMNNNQKDYTNGLTNTTYQISKKTNDYLKKTIEGIFKLVNKFVES